MNFLIASKGGDGLALGLALQHEGHEVAIAIEKTDAQRAGEGLLEHVDDPIHHARDEDVDCVLFDMVGMGGMADALCDLDIPVYGAGRALDKLELDRIFGLQTFKALGLAVPPTEIFPDANFDRALEFLKSNPGAWVFKPHGNLGTDKTFIGNHVEEMVEFIEHQRDSAKGEDVKHPAFVLQKFVKGYEVSIERWYSRGRPVAFLDNCTFEEKKFLAGNLGPAIGCAGNVVLGADPKLIARTIDLLDAYALAHNLSSPVDLNTIIDARTGIPYILEATARFGYDALWAFLHKWNGDLGEFFLALAEGDDLNNHLSPAMAAAVRVSVPPYPSGDPKQARGTPVVDDILDHTEPNKHDVNLWPGDVMEDPDGDLVVAGVDGVVYIVTALGETPEDAYQGCYDWLEDARLPDRQYRVDLTDRVVKDLKSLRQMGYFPLTARRIA